MKFAIYLNKEHEAFSATERELKRQFAELETVKFQEIAEPPKPGTLGIPGDVVAFIAEHTGEIIYVAKGILAFLAYLAKRYGTKEEGEPSRKTIFVFMAGDSRVRFPASQKKQADFLDEIQKPPKKRQKKKTKKKKKQKTTKKRIP